MSDGFEQEADEDTASCSKKGCNIVAWLVCACGMHNRCRGHAIEAARKDAGCPESGSDE